MKTREEIIAEATKAWYAANKKGTVELITGMGKTKLALDIASTYDKSAKILFLAETTQREIDLGLEIQKWNYSGPDIEFMCYQSAYKLQNETYDLVIADEIHDSLTEVYSSFYFNNTCKSILGLSATVDKKAKVTEDGSVKKGDLLKLIAPVCFKYTVDDGQKHGTARKLKIYQIWHTLDAVNKNMPAGTKEKPFLTTEKDGYTFYDDRFKRALFLPDGKAKTFQIQNASRKRAEILYKIQSKVVATSELISKLNSRAILFGNDLDTLMKITPNVVCSRYTPKQNEELRNKFESGAINLIASFKQLKQGANLGGLQDCIIHSYYSKQKDLIQRIGRLRNDGTLGRVFVFVTQQTVEEKWFKSMFEDITAFEVVQCHNVADCLTKL
jgi:superfamily II DNA or RNA helicase